MPCTHTVPPLGVQHRPPSRPRTSGRAQTTAERHRPGNRTTDPPRRHRLPGIRGRQPGILPPPGRQRPRQHTLLHAAQACQELPSSRVQQHLGVCPRAPSVVPRLVAAPLPAGPQRRRFQPVAAGDAADQRRRRLSVQGSGAQQAGVMGHSTTVSCLPPGAHVFTDVDVQRTKQNRIRRGLQQTRVISPVAAWARA